MAKRRVMTVHFIDGTRVSFDFPEQTPTDAIKQIKAEEFLKSPVMLVEADGALLVIPKSNIKYLQLMATEEGAIGKMKLPTHAIRGATIVG